MKCTKCGIEVPSSYLKCPSCGQGFHGLNTPSSFKENPQIQSSNSTQQSSSSIPAFQGTPLGIGGWLILPAISIPIGILIIFFSSINLFKPFLEPGVWSALTTPELSTYVPYFSLVFFSEIIFNLSYLILLLYVGFLFYKKSSKLPRMYIFMLIYAFLGNSIDLAATSFVLPDALGENPFKQVMHTLISLIVWGLYFAKSQRVKNTFIN